MEGNGKPFVCLWYQGYRQGWEEKLLRYVLITWYPSIFIHFHGLSFDDHLFTLHITRCKPSSSYTDIPLLLPYWVIGQFICLRIYSFCYLFLSLLRENKKRSKPESLLWTKLSLLRNGYSTFLVLLKGLDTKSCLTYLQYSLWPIFWSYSNIVNLNISRLGFTHKFAVSVQRTTVSVYSFPLTSKSLGHQVHTGLVCLLVMELFLYFLSTSLITSWSLTTETLELCQSRLVDPWFKVYYLTLCTDNKDTDLTWTKPKTEKKQ